jgi:hypothetical protein
MPDFGGRRPCLLRRLQRRPVPADPSAGEAEAEGRPAHNARALDQRPRKITARRFNRYDERSPSRSGTLRPPQLDAAAAPIWEASRHLSSVPDRRRRTSSGGALGGRLPASLRTVLAGQVGEANGGGGEEFSLAGRLPPRSLPRPLGGRRGASPMPGVGAPRRGKSALLHLLLPADLRKRAEVGVRASRYLPGSGRISPGRGVAAGVSAPIPRRGRRYLADLVGYRLT